MKIICIKMSPFVAFMTPDIWDGSPAEIDRISIFVEDHLGLVGIENIFTGAGFTDKSGYFDTFIGKAGGDKTKFLRPDKWFVPLYVYNDINLTSCLFPYKGKGFRASVSSARVLFGCHNGSAAETQHSI